MRIRSTPHTTSHRLPVQLRMALDSDVLQRLSVAERARATVLLANLLLLAAGVTVKEHDDDQQR